MPSLRNKIRRFFRNTKDDIEDFVDLASEDAKRADKAVSALLDGDTKKAKREIKKTNLSEAVQDLSDSLEGKDSWQRGVEKLGRETSKGWDEVLERAENLEKKLLDALDEIDRRNPEPFSKRRKGPGNSFGEGIKNFFNNIFEATVKFFGKIKDFLKNAFGGKSNHNRDGRGGGGSGGAGGYKVGRSTPEVTVSSAHEPKKYNSLLVEERVKQSKESEAKRDSSVKKSGNLLQRSQQFSQTTKSFASNEEERRKGNQGKSQKRS
ncbi:MAG: hypothetical protein K0Q51_275 [Rickettsiaceae bacterium]|jgi:hypothetical protein|nr:hypothetical protein [Rickettsiaceae bacterium]